MYVEQTSAEDDENAFAVEPISDARGFEEKVRFPLILVVVALLSGLITFVIQHPSLFTPRDTVTREQQAATPTEEERKIPVSTKPASTGHPAVVDTPRPTPTATETTATLVTTTSMSQITPTSDTSVVSSSQSVPITESSTPPTTTPAQTTPVSEPPSTTEVSTPSSTQESP